jgi:death-on-curing protein
MDGEDLYPEIIDKIGRLAYGLIANHPMFDGNKRLGILVLLVLLDLNKAVFNFADLELIRLGSLLADGSLSLEGFLEYLRELFPEL